MSDEVAFSSHVIKRGEIYQYVRRIPEDVAHAFPIVRIQRSLKTRDKSKAYAAAAEVHQEVERRIAEARRAAGVTLDVISVADWTWPDWQALADWMHAWLLEEDWKERLSNLPGEAFGTGVERKRVWRENAVVRAHMDLRTRLGGMTVSTYAEERLSYLQSVVRRLGVPLGRDQAYYDRFAAACMRSEVRYLDTFLARERGETGEQPHPDSIRGPWRSAAERIREKEAARILGTPASVNASIGKSLTDCLEQWIRDRTKARKLVTPHGRKEKELAIEDFEQFFNVQDISEVTRARVVAYRDHLSEKDLKVPTYNKRVGQITTLMTVAKRAGWIAEDIGGDIMHPVPAGTNEREPFSREELAQIFSNRTFSSGHRSTNLKAAGELQFWLPLVSLTGGLISSEIIQLGPDTVGPHPEHTEIICFQVTNAGGRAVKAAARKRYVPVRRELWDGGLKTVVGHAAERKLSRLWPAAESAEVTSVSNMFSAFWSEVLRKEIGIIDVLKALYSFRHNFRDALSVQGATPSEKDQLMGHAEGGTGALYGAKRGAREVDIRRLNDLVQSASWPCLSFVRWPEELRDA